jgi:(R,R)-butanediol dehydrogenase/meso-butanediol dehydrogenase/diacetyl reductase
MVLGAGTIGLGVIAMLKNSGAGLIIATETVDRRKELAKKFGADYLLDPNIPGLEQKVFELTGGRGVDIVFDCSGVGVAFKSASSFLRRGGQIVLVGQIMKETPILPLDFTLRELQLQGISCYYSDEFPMVMEFLTRRHVTFDEIITSRIQLSEITEKGFEVLSKPNNEIKVIVFPD